MTAILRSLPTKHIRRHIWTKGQNKDSTNARPIRLIIITRRTCHKIRLQPSQPEDKSIITLLAPVEVFVVSSRLVAPEISDLSGQFSKAIYEIRQSQSNQGDGGDERGDDGWVGHGIALPLTLPINRPIVTHLYHAGLTFEL